MGIKLIVMDMDGTLLKDDKTISNNNLTVLTNLEKKGVRLALASGRSINRLSVFSDELALSKYNGFLIEANGVGIYDYKNNNHEIIERMNRKDAAELIDLLSNQMNKEVIVMGERNAFIILPIGRSESLWQENVTMESLRGRDITVIKSLDEVNEEINKICVYEDENSINEVYEKLSSYSSKYWYGKVLKTWLEITPINVNKGNALRRIMEENNIKKDEVIVFGDGENDISMLKEVKYGIAMSNALDSVKQVCYSICRSNEEDGIASYLENFKEI